ARHPRLPVDALLRLRCVHRLRPRARGRVARATGGRQSGHGAGSEHRQLGAGGAHMRLRMRFAKLGKVRWTSHRDVARMWERAFRRVELPVAYSGGFAPRPKVSFGLALPTGCESTAEYLDVELATEAIVDAGRLSAALPVGVDVLALAPLEGGDSLQQEVTSCTWTAEVGDADAAALAEAVLTAESLPATRERKG